MREDWIESPFGVYVNKISTTKQKLKQKEYQSSGLIPVIDQGQKLIGGYTDDSSRVLKCKLPAFVFGDHTKAIKLINFKFAPGADGTKVLEIKDGIEPKLIYYFAHCVLHKIDKGYARHYQHLEKEIIPLPPLPEQRAIVAKIEELFSSLDNGIANLKKAQEQLKVYRQAVLKKAFDLDAQKYKIEDVCKQIFAGGDKPKDYFSKTKTNDLQIPILANAVANKGIYGYTKTAKVNELAITIAGRGSGTGHVELRREPFVPIVRLITIIPNLEKVVAEYLIYFLRNLNIKGSGSAIPQLTIPMVKGFEVHLPEIEGQHQIVQEIESRLSVCDKVEESIIEGLQKAKALKQSILKKAFDGALLSEVELKACRQEADWEPAEVLLERIRAEKASQSTDKKQVVKKRKSKSKPTPKPISETDLHAAIICKVIKAHESANQLDKLGHVKCEKIVHFAEYHLGLSVGRKPVKDAAGPDDYPHLKKVESRAKKAAFFFEKKQQLGSTYEAGKQIDKLIAKLEDKVDDKLLVQLDAIIYLFLPFDKVTAEIPATLYAGWNNLLLKGLSPTDDEIIYESRENWSESKLKIPRERFVNGLAWLRKHKLVPTGTGLLVDKRKK